MAMAFPEDSRSEDRVSLGEREQILIASDKVVGLCRAQGSQDRLIGLVAQGCLRFGAGLDDLRHEEEAVGEIADFSGSERYARQPRQDSNHLVQNVSRQDQIEFALPPGAQDASWNTGGSRQRQYQDVGVQDNAQASHQRRRWRATAASISAMPTSAGTSAYASATRLLNWSHRSRIARMRAKRSAPTRAATGLPSLFTTILAFRYWTWLSISPRFWRKVTAFTSVTIASSNHNDKYAHCDRYGSFCRGGCPRSRF